MTGVLGIGAYANEEAIVDEIAASEAGCCLLFEGALERVSEVRARLPNWQIFGRRYKSDAEQETLLARPDRAAVTAYWVGAAADERPEVDYWLIYNEFMAPGANDPTLGRLKRQVEAEMAALDALKARGKKGVVINAPPGVTPTPDPRDTARLYWPLYVATVKPLLEHPACAFLGDHCYSNGDFSLLNSLDAEWYGLRSLKLRAALAAEGIAVEVAVTEVAQTGGWRKVGPNGQWLNAEQAWADFQWWALKVLAAGHVRGFVFLDSSPGEVTWATYNIRGSAIPAYMGAFNRAHPMMEVAMAYDRHQVFDGWQKSLGGQGFNPADAFGQFRNAHPEIDCGVLVSPYIGYVDPSNPYIYAYTTTGIFIVPKGGGQVIFADRESELPPA